MHSSLLKLRALSALTTNNQRHLRKGISPVISTIMIAAAVVTIGGAVWFYAHGASSVTAKDYIDYTFELVNDVAERYTIEYISNNTDCTILHIWIYNYGNVNVTADVYVSTNDTLYTSDLDNPIYIAPVSMFVKM